MRDISDLRRQNQELRDIAVAKKLADEFAAKIKAKSDKL